MPPVAFLHSHILAVVLFLVLFATKTTLLLLNKHKALDKLRSKTKALDIVFGTLTLVTGGYLLLLYNGELPAWLIVKLVLVLLAVPLGILGIKRDSKVLAVVSLLLFLYTYGVAETKSLYMSRHKASAVPTTETPAADAVETGDASLSQSQAVQEEIVSDMGETQLANAKAIYEQVCANCHGPDGAKGLGSAANLTLSELSLNDRIHVIEKGRGLMPGFGGQLTEQETEALAAYTITLKTN
jgi:mono/diheme cytochrome c family protein